jgi:hypothetical protein
MVWLPRWLDDELHGRGRVFAAAVGLLVLLVGALWDPWGRNAEAPATAAVRAPAQTVSAVPTPTAATATQDVAAASAPAPLAACAHQHLDITAAAEVQRGCVSATRTRQDGSVRRYSVEPEGVSAWRLDAELAAETVLSVRLQRVAVGTAPEQWYVCDGPACQGVSLGAADAHGVRMLNFADTRLRALPAGQGVKQRLARVSAGASATPAEDDTALRLSAMLKVLPQRSGSALACSSDLGVKVLDSRGAATDFCPLGGAGFSMDEADHLRFEFRDLDGRELVVALAADQSIASVSLGGATCKAPHCGGVSMRANGDAADPAVQRSFTFSGTSLTQSSPTSLDVVRVTLTGGVTMPAQ